ncbi:MAG TPA: hypothetical protein VEI48_01565 [Candidatus Sulfotelmatobacter sp.]|nr:hypothetical protein [Candidatus Sulfotelmatobacter sp.]
MGAVLGASASLVAGLLVVGFLVADGSGATSSNAGPPTIVVVVFTLPGTVYAGWRLGPGAGRGRRLVWAGLRFCVLATVATAAFWEPVVVVGFALSTITLVSDTGAVTTVGMAPGNILWVALLGPLYALFYAGFALVMTSPIVVPVSLAWAAALRRLTPQRAEPA